MLGFAETYTSSLQVTIVSFGVLLIKYYLTILIQGYKRVLGGSRPPEDSRLFKGAGEQSFNGLAKFAGKTINDRYVKSLKESEMRWLRIVNNDVENIPFGVVMGLFSLSYGDSHSFHAFCVGSFAICRVMHTLSYAYALQPHRAIAFGGGVSATFGMLLNVCLSARHR